MQNSNLYKWLITSIFIGLSSYIFAQYTLGISGSYSFGANSSPIQITHQKVDQKWHQGYQFNLWNGYQLPNHPIEITSRLGVKKLSSRGVLKEQTFTTEAYKFQLGAGALYQFDSTINIGALFVLENNLDADQFISQTADLFRYSFQVESSYFIWKGLAVRALYSIALSPLSDHYLVTNPQHQLAVGVYYKFL